MKSAAIFMKVYYWW